MNFDFTGKTAVVTGGSRGIGAAVSVLFASCGANVMIDHLPVENDLEGLRRVEAEIRKRGGSTAQDSPGRPEWPASPPICGLGESR
jgi:NAD(P)-dependent dehydrogenase (short-subunit alcohol dehydrogenase family)